MQATTQIGLKRLLHFTAVWDYTFKTALIKSIGKSESLVDSLQIIGRHTDKETEEKAMAFAHKLPYVNLESFIIDHQSLVAICDPTKIPNANYAALMVFGQHVWVVTDKPAAPVFRQKLREILKTYVPVIVTAKKEDIEKVAEEARRITSLGVRSTSKLISDSPEKAPDTIRIEDEVVPVIKGDLGRQLVEKQVEKTTEQGELQRVFYPITTKPVTTAEPSTELAQSEKVVEVKPVKVRYVGIPGDAIQKFEETFRKLDRETASSGKEMFQVIASISYGLGATSLHITPDDGVHGHAVFTLRTPKGVTTIGKIRMSNYTALSQVLRDIHGMGAKDEGKKTGLFQVKYMLERSRQTLESECFSIQYGGQGVYEAFHIRLHSNTLPLLPEIVNEKADVDKLFELMKLKGLIVVGSSHLEARRDFMGSLISALDADTIRIGVINLPSGGCLRFGKLDKHNSAESIEMITSMDVDAILVGDVTPDQLAEFVKYACGDFQIILGMSALSMKNLHSIVHNQIKDEGAERVLNALIYLEIDKAANVCVDIWDTSVLNLDETGFNFGLYPNKAV